MDKSYIDIKTAAGNRQLVLGGQAVTIGRHADNQIVVPDGMASRFHCVIERTPDGYLLRDLGSSNGTIVNGRRIRSTLLHNGDLVVIGSSRLTLVLPDAPARSVETKPVDRVKAVSAVDDDIIELDESAEIPEEIEMLTEADLADVEPPVVPGGYIPVGVVEESARDFEHALRSLADSIPDRTFGAGDITLVNPRGSAVAEGGRGASDGPANTTYLLRLLLLGALRARATDLHLEPKGETYQARMRVDGVMIDAARLPADIGSKLAAAVKVVADIDPSQKTIIQEGNFSCRLPGGRTAPPGYQRRVDFRVSFAPAVFGQKLVLRVLDPLMAPGRLNDLALPEQVNKELANAIEQESGMVLVCGPTGSGKTSTLYALIRSINTRERNVVTIEDPVEIQIDGATQIPVDDEKGNGFPQLLRSVLRQDPDVILVGEIRDAETARIAMQASITGHLVFSTVHTKDTVGALFRLLDLGVEPYLLAQGLHVIVAQRLVRQLCAHCKFAKPITPDQNAKMGPTAENVQVTFYPVGCKKCLGTGYAGRRAFFELLSASDTLREAISQNPNIKDVSAALAGTGFRKLSQAGYELVAEGSVPFDEVEKAVGR